MASAKTEELRRLLREAERQDAMEHDMIETSLSDNMARLVARANFLPGEAMAKLGEQKIIVQTITEYDEKRGTHYADQVVPWQKQAPVLAELLGI